ncbi:MAG: exodeoxyribonuclease VII small subunit [Candidatus Izemoplasmatales bacterium]|jgi:exodeoxyribonuclease VII small subunit|nr:exodeoxyribonuclease VII small subunit [Candidatus Izemoplasmatales bacterium]
MDKKITFEEALKKLESIVKELESGQLSLENSVSKYNEGIELATFCNLELKNAEVIVVKMMNQEQLVDFQVKEEE